MIRIVLDGWKRMKMNLLANGIGVFVVVSGIQNGCIFADKESILASDLGDDGGEGESREMTIGSKREWKKVQEEVQLERLK